MESSRPDKNADEKEKNDEICRELSAEIAKADDEKARQGIVAKMAKFSPQRLFTLCTLNEDIRTFCEAKDFNAMLVKCDPEFSCYDNDDLPTEPVQAIDKSLTISTFEQLIGYVLADTAFELLATDPANSHAKKTLDHACKIGAFHALIVRMQINLNLLKNSELKTTGEVDPALKQILADANLMGKLYRSLGYAHATTYLLEAARHYMKIAGVELAREFYKLSASQVSRAKNPTASVEKSPSIELLDDVLEKILENYFLFLYSLNPQSATLENTIMTGNQLLQEFYKVCPELQTNAAAILEGVFVVGSPDSFFRKGFQEAQKVAAQTPAEYPSYSKKDMSNSS